MKETLIIGSEKIVIKYEPQVNYKEMDTCCEDLMSLLCGITEVLHIGLSIYFLLGFVIGIVGAILIVLFTLLIIHVLKRNVRRKQERKEREVLEKMRTEAILKLLDK